MQKKDAITAELIVRLIGSVAQTEGVTLHIATLLQAVIVLIPKAFENAGSFAGHLYDLRGAVEKLAAKTDAILGLVENPVGADNQTGDQIHKVMEVLETVSQKTEATEKTAEDTKTTLLTFVEQQALRQEQPWSKVGRTNKQSHRESEPGPQDRREPLSGSNAVPIASRRNQPSKKPSSQELPPDAIQRCRYQAATFLVRPKDPNNKNLSKYDARALVKMATETLEAAWDRIRTTDFASSKGLTMLPKIVFKTARRLPSGGILFELAEHTHAALLSLAPFAMAFEDCFPEEVISYGQQADMFVDGAPVAFDPTSEQNIRALESENQLERGSVLYCSWVKPAEMRAPGQTRAVLRISLRSQDVADELIANRGVLEGERVTFRRIVEEPLRCMRCQRYGHKANECRSRQDVCSRCAGGHCSSECLQPNRLACANCHSEEHAAWSKRCEAYLAAREKFSNRRPENDRPFFNPTRVHLVEQVGELTAMMESIRMPELTIGDTLTGEGKSRPATIPSYFARTNTSRTSGRPSSPPAGVQKPADTAELEEGKWSESDVGKAVISLGDLPVSPPTPPAARPSSRSPLETRLWNVLGGRPAPSRLTLSKVFPDGARARAISISSTSSQSSHSSSSTATPDSPTLMVKRHGSQA
ncbi:hypothetical protein RhiJN_19750 [Ceratobasidium sp. AG-Ba]|nr:hypothetical protein RhiJN_19750 [Ceratobasidium sp. AG-Ba]